MRSDDVDSAIDQSHFAMSEIVKGNPEPRKVLFSHREDVTLGNPFGPFARGRPQAVETFTAAAARYQEGEVVAFEPIARHITESWPASWKWSATGPRSVAATTSP